MFRSTSSRSKLLLSSTIIVLALLSDEVRAKDLTWYGTNTTFATWSNWRDSLGNLPSPTTNVATFVPANNFFISADNSSFNPNLFTSLSVGTVTISDLSFSLFTGANLTTTGVIVNDNGGLTTRAGSKLSGDVTVNKGGRWGVTDTIHNGNVTVNSGGNWVMGGWLTNTGNVTVNSGGNLSWNGSTTGALTVTGNVTNAGTMALGGNAVSGITTLTNSGTISGSDSLSASTIVNSGSITGTTYGLNLTNAVALTNSGTISGGTAAVKLGANGNKININPGGVFTGGIDYNNTTGNTTAFGTGSYTLAVKNYAAATNAITVANSSTVVSVTNNGAVVYSTSGTSKPSGGTSTPSGGSSSSSGGTSTPSGGSSTPAVATPTPPTIVSTPPVVVSTTPAIVPTPPTTPPTPPTSAPTPPAIVSTPAASVPTPAPTTTIAVVNASGSALAVQSQTQAVSGSVSMVVSDVLGQVDAGGEDVGNTMGSTESTSTSMSARMGYAEEGSPVDDTNNPFNKNNFKPAQGLVNDGMGNLLWSRGFAGTRYQPSAASAPATRSTYEGIMMGYDRRFDDWRFGGFAGYSHVGQSSSNGSGDVKGDVYYGGLYGRREIGSWAVNLGLTGGSINNKSTRYITVNSGAEAAEADFNGFFVAPEVALSYAYKIDPAWTLTSTARLRYTGTFYDGYSEKGSSQNITYGAQSVHMLEERAEVRLGHTVELEDGSLFNSYVQGAAFGIERLGSSSTSASVFGTNIMLNSAASKDTLGASLGAGFDWRVNKDLTLFAGADGLIYSNKARGVSGRVGVRVSF